MNTLKYYQELISKGISEEQAEILSYAMEAQESNIINRFKDEFASNKMVTLLGTIIITIGGFTLAKVWDLSHDMVEVKSRLCVIENKVLK